MFEGSSWRTSWRALGRMENRNVSIRCLDGTGNADDKSVSHWDEQADLIGKNPAEVRTCLPPSSTAEVRTSPSLTVTTFSRRKTPVLLSKSECWGEYAFQFVLIPRV